MCACVPLAWLAHKLTLARSAKPDKIQIKKVTTNKDDLQLVVFVGLIAIVLALTSSPEFDKRARDPFNGD